MDMAQSMVSFVKVLVVDAERSSRFYEALGFERVQAAPPFIHLKWAGRADVYLVSLPGGRGVETPRGFGVLLGFPVGDVGLEEVATRARAQGAHVEGPLQQPWHTRELLITDPDGYRLNFIAPI